MVVKVSKPEINVREKISELDKPSGTAGQAILAAETPQEQFNLISAGRKNLFYNGAMQIAQRSTSAVTVSDNSNEGYSTVDRWKVDFGSAMGGALQAERVGSPAGHGPFSESLKLSCTTVNSGAMTSGSVRFLSVAQYLEGNDLQQLCYGEPDAKHTTYSFWVYTNKIGRYGFGVISRDSGDSYDCWGSYFDVPTANVWQKVVFTVEGNTAADIKRTNSFGLLVDIYLACAANRAGISDSRWQTYSTARLPGTYTDYVDFLDNTSNVFYVTGLQLEVGKVATPFEHRSYGEELALCQRYYYQIGGAGQGGGGFDYLAHGFADTTTRAIHIIHFPQNMRAAPTLVSSQSASNFYWRAPIGNPTSPSATSLPTLGGSSTIWGRVDCNGTGFSAGTGCFFEQNNSVNTFIAFNAEL
jgi:hypothetical protein